MRAAIFNARAARIAACDGMSASAAASKLGLSPNTIAKYRKLAGYDPKAAKMAQVEAIRACASEGISREDAAAKLGLKYHTLCAVVRAHGIAFRHAREGQGVDLSRAEVMASMFRSGKTLEEIRSIYGVSRERVRQIIKKRHGITGEDGGKCARAEARRIARMAKKDAKYQAKFGCTFAQWQELVRRGKEMRVNGAGKYQAPTYAFNNQRRNAASRGIGWNLTLLQWWTIWEASGKWEQRGRGRGYMMCRFGDTGAYEVGNVYIATGVHNGTVQPNNPYRTDHPDHEKVVALLGRRVGVRVGRPRKYPDLPTGVTIRKGRGRFVAQISIRGANRYLGSFATSSEAQAAYQAALAELTAAAA